MKQQRTIDSELSEKNIDICTISEVKKKRKETHVINNYVFTYSGKPKNERGKAGVGMLLHIKFQPCIENVEYISEYIMEVEMKIDNKCLHIISVYAPDSSKSREERRQFYEELQKHIDTIPSHHQVIIMGVLNAHVGNIFLQGVKQRFNEAVSNDNEDLMTDFCAQNDTGEQN